MKYKNKLKNLKARQDAWTALIRDSKGKNISEANYKKPGSQTK